MSKEAAKKGKVPLSVGSSAQCRAVLSCPVLLLLLRSLHQCSVLCCAGQLATLGALWLRPVPSALDSVSSQWTMAPGTRPSAIHSMLRRTGERERRGLHRKHARSIVALQCLSTFLPSAITKISSA